MARGRRRRVTPLLAWLLTGAVAMPLMAGCGVLPELPDGVPGDVVPTSAPSLGSHARENLSPDGFDAVQRMAVRIRNVGCTGLSTGSGFAVDEHTLITNRHVVADSDVLEISTYDGRDLEASAASTARLADLAVVRTKDPLPSFPQLAEHDPVPGDTVLVVGYPEGGELAVTEGTVMGFATDPLNENLGEVLVTDVPVEPGSSGSAALDTDGRVIGVVYAKTSDERSLLIPLSTLQKLLVDEEAFTAVQPCG
jgi:S1-C subfamily serine protease